MDQNILVRVALNNPELIGRGRIHYGEGLGYQTQFMSDFNTMINGFSYTMYATLGSATLGAVYAEHLVNAEIGALQRGINVFMDFTTQMIVNGGHISKVDGISLIGSGLGTNPFVTSAFSFTANEGFVVNSTDQIIIGGITASASSSVHGFYSSKVVPFSIGLRKGPWRIKEVNPYFSNSAKFTFDLYGKTANEILINR